jgi:hypothetical protein
MKLHDARGSLFAKENRMRGCAVLWVLVLALMLTSRARAQTWSLEREGPSLFEIIAVDATGEPLWPYKQEDLAGDGAQTELADEAAVDLRTAYADARAARLWLRAYVRATVAPTASSVAFFFIDTDANTKSGGSASGTQLWPAFPADPTPGGYERAVGLRGDGTLLGLFFWDAAKKQWAKQPESPPLTATEAGIGHDPLRILGDDHGYFQASLDLSVAGLDAACGGAIFVRLWNDANGKRSFGDDADMKAASCHANLNRFGDPALLQSDVCTADESCPAQGHCRSGSCVFGYACGTDNECRSGEHCTAGVCTRVVDKTCKLSADCDGLVCDAGRCVACSDTGARACTSGWLCRPDGSCLAAQTASAGTGPSSAGSGAAGSGAPRVRGGAFSCSAGSPRASSDTALLWWALIGLGLARRTRRSPRRFGR